MSIKWDEICYVDRLNNCYEDERGRKQIKCKIHKTPLKSNGTELWCLFCDIALRSEDVSRQ